MVDLTRATLTLTVEDVDDLRAVVTVLSRAAVDLAQLGLDVPLLIGPDVDDDCPPSDELLSGNRTVGPCGHQVLGALDALLVCALPWGHKGLHTDADGASWDAVRHWPAGWPSPKGVTP